MKSYAFAFMALLLMCTEGTCSQSVSNGIPSRLLLNRSEEPVHRRLIETLGAESIQDRDLAIKSAAKQRQEIVKELISIVDGNKALEIKMDAARVLGYYRAPESVGVLVKNIELEDHPRSMVTGLVTDEEMNARVRPISVALEKIGVPAIPALHARLLETDDEKLVRKYIVICVKIDGKDVARFRLQNALEKQMDAKSKARLESALKMLEQLSDK